MFGQAGADVPNVGAGVVAANDGPVELAAPNAGGELLNPPA